MTYLVFVADGAQGNTPDFELRFGTAMVSGFYPNFFFCAAGKKHNNDSRFQIGLYVERSALKGMGGDGGSTFKVQNNDSTCQLCSYITGTALWSQREVINFKITPRVNFLHLVQPFAL